MSLRQGPGTAPVDGGFLAYEVGGDGPPLVTTHPYAMPSRAFEPIHGLATITAWPRGFGASSPARDDSDFGLWRVADNLDGLRRHLAIERWAIWGVSMGGFCALIYALRYPEHVSALVLDSTAPSHHYTQDPDSIWPALFAGREASAFYADPSEANRAAFFARIREMEQERDPRAGEGAAGLEVNARALGLILRSLNAYDVRDQLERIRAPTLILAGERDSQCPPGQARVIAAGIAGARLKVYPDLGHGVVRTGPPEVREFVREFVTSAADAP